MPERRETTPRFKVLITDYKFADIEQERGIIESAGGELRVTQCRTEDDVIAEAGDAEGLIVQFAPITARVAKNLKNCRLIVRYGHGVDTIDLAATKEVGIAVCNVPDFCTDEVADSAMAFTLSLVRQIPFIDRRLRQGVWQLALMTPARPCRDLLFATFGYGHIARAVLQRASSFRFQVAAHDPYIPKEVFERDDIRRLTLDEMFQEADVISLHAPLNNETRHTVNARRLAQMKPTAILVNTARGGLVDELALAVALNNRTIAYAGLDVFETEPLPPDHPLLYCDNALLTSHTAWISEKSEPELQRLTAEEMVRGMRGEPLRSQVNL